MRVDEAMKKIFTNSVFMFILGAVIFSGITSVVALTFFAGDIIYEPSKTEWEVSNVKEALDDLYVRANQKPIYLTISWKIAQKWNDYGFANNIFVDNNYIAINGSHITILKDCKIKITGVVKNTEKGSGNQIYNLIQNGTSILYFTNGAAAETITMREIVVDVKENDDLYLRLYGGGKATFYVTYMELVNE